MRSFGVFVGLAAIVLICAAAPAPADEDAAIEARAEGLLAVDAQTTHENESQRKARYFFSPYSGLYGYGYNGYGGYYGGYGGYGGLYGYGGYPYYGYGSYPYGGYTIYG